MGGNLKLQNGTCRIAESFVECGKQSHPTDCQRAREYSISTKCIRIAD